MHRLECQFQDMKPKLSTLERFKRQFQLMHSLIADLKHRLDVLEGKPVGNQFDDTISEEDEIVDDMSEDEDPRAEVGGTTMQMEEINYDCL